MTADVILTEKSIKELIQRKLAETVQDEMTIALDKAKADMERNVKDSLGRLVISLLDYYSVERDGKSIIIRVENKL